MEENWHLKSRAIFLEFRDNNAKTIQKYANEHRFEDSIWVLKEYSREIIKDQNDLKVVVVSYFKYMNKKNETISLEDQLKLIKNFPFFFYNEGQ